MPDELNAVIAREYTTRLVADAAREAGVSASAAPTLAALMADSFTLRPGADGRPELVGSDGRPAADVIRARISDPAYSHFLSPEARQAQAAADFTARLQQSIAQQQHHGDPHAMGLLGTGPAAVRRS